MNNKLFTHLRACLVGLLSLFLTAILTAQPCGLQKNNDGTFVIKKLTAKVIDSCGTFYLLLSNLTDNDGSGPVEYIVIGSGEAQLLRLGCGLPTNRTVYRTQNRVDSIKIPIPCNNPVFKVLGNSFGRQDIENQPTICRRDTIDITPALPLAIEKRCTNNPCAGDTVKPVISNCPQNVIAYGRGECAKVDWTPPTATDNCGLLSFTSNFPPNTCFPFGRTTTVTYTAFDKNDNKATCSFTVNAQDYCTANLGELKSNFMFSILDSCGERKLKIKTQVNARVVFVGLDVFAPVEYVVTLSQGSEPLRLGSPCAQPGTIKFYQDTCILLCPNVTVKQLTFNRDTTICAGSFPTKPDPIPVIVAPDSIKPILSLCPQNINKTTNDSCVIVTWKSPTITDNCDPDPSLSSNYESGACFPIGTKTVIYTGKDKANNTTTCSFTVTVTAAPQQICKSYDALNTNAVCGCDALKYQPYGFYLDGIGTCPADFFKPDGALRFQINADSTATLKGNFRNNRTWELVVADITLSGRTSKPPTGSPNLMYCQQRRPTSVANTWQYFTGMSGTLKVASKTLIISRSGAAFQVGVGANNQNVDKMGASGSFVLSDGKTGSFGLILGSELSFDCGNPTSSSNDVAVSVQAASSTFTRYMTMNYTIGAKNVGTTAMKDVVVEFRFPTGTANGGTVSPSVGKWQEWCAGNVQCFRWTIPALAVGQGATLNVPVFVLDVNKPIVATAKLLATSPTDGNAVNDVATTTITKFVSAAAALATQKPTQLIPIVIQKLAPNPTENEIILELESLKEGDVTLHFSTPMGQVIRSEKVGVEKGTNRILIDVSKFAQGIYFVTPSTNASRQMPIKFVKM